MIRMIDRSLRDADRVAFDDEISFRHLYFTSTSLTENDDRIIVAGKDRAGVYNFYEIDVESGQKHKITDQSDPPRYYLDGIAETGLHVNGACFDARSRALYYVQNNLVTVSSSGRTDTIAALPESEAAGIAHVSADGRLLCVPTTDRAAFEKDAEWGRSDRGIDARMQRQQLRSHLNIFDTYTGLLIAREPVPCAWVTHVQFNPADNRQVLYNHEWPAKCGVRRMWIWDGKSHLPLRSAEGRRSEEDWTCHEMWEHDGSAVIYHGRYSDGTNYIGRRDSLTGTIIEIPLPREWNRYGHFVTGPQNNVLATDGYFSNGPNDDRPQSPWLSILSVDWNTTAIDWTVVGANSSSWQGQAAHPHPIFSHAGNHLFYSSDEGGRGSVWRLPLKQ